MSVTTHTDVKLEKIKNRANNNQNKEKKSYEDWAISNEKLLLERWGGRESDVGVFTAPSLNIVAGELWYRAMGKVEFDTLYNTGVLAPPGYGGITNTRVYSEGYLEVAHKKTYEEDLARTTHLVEFHIRSQIKLRNEFRYLGLNEKVEQGATSFGLGPAQKEGAGGEYFNNLLISRLATWRLVSVLIDV